jgi:histidinol dehydrogenase
VRQGSRIRVATKYTQIAREHFAAKGVHVDLIKLYGSMELAPLTGLADAIVDLVSTGSTLKANHLVEVERIMDISARLVVNQAALKLKREPMRAPDRRLRGRVATTPSTAPTTMSLADPPACHTASADFEAEFQRVLHWSAETDAAIEQRVAQIIADVRARGDAAVLELTARFDGLQPTAMAALEIGADDCAPRSTAHHAGAACALQAAPARVRDYHQRQLDACCRSWSYRDADGTLLGQKVTPLDRVGIYVPGGKAAYPSSLIMNAVPAHVAGVARSSWWCPRRCLAASPPVAAKAARHVGHVGERNDLVLAAAARGRRHRAFTIGGAQAVAALAYGTATVPRVDKITGPGNAYVASAKRRVFGQVGIDMIAGPSEILVLADGSTPPDWVAMDLFSQAEHDELAQSILLCPDAGLHRRRCGGHRPPAARHAAARRDPRQPGRPRRADPHAQHGRSLRHQQPHRARAPGSQRADPHRWEPLLRHAGAIFLGAFTSESLGDYCAGPNHVLPTSGTARFSSPLGVYDFVKRSSLIEVSEAGAQVLGPIAADAGLRRRAAGACPGG